MQTNIYIGSLSKVGHQFIEVKCYEIYSVLTFTAGIPKQWKKYQNSDGAVLGRVFLFGLAGHLFAITSNTLSLQLFIAESFFNDHEYDH